MLKATNLGAFDAKVKAWFEAAKEAAEDAAVGLAKQVFEQVIYTSPQYSGDFAANWKLKIGSPDDSFQMDAVIPGAHSFANPIGAISRISPTQVGSLPAINYAKRTQAGKLEGFQLGQKIYVTNHAFHPTLSEPGTGAIDRYAPLIEDGRINLRPVNSGAEHVLARAATFTMNRNRNITAAQLRNLRSFGV